MATRLPLYTASVDGPPPETLERCAADDQFHDYIHESYTPRAPAVGMLRSVNLLHASFRHAGVEAEGRALVEHVRSAFGRFRTVFGIKHRVGTTEPLGWELYFYDFQRVQADLSIERIRALLAPFVHVDVVEPWPLPWLMISVEVGLPQLRERVPASMDVYLDLRSYKARGREWQLENLYTFHDPKREIDAILHRAKSLVHFDATRWNLASILHPDLLACHRLCIANKRAADAVYASRISTEAALRFVTRHEFPQPFVDFFAEHRAELAHLSWDVGVDFEGSSGSLRFTKAGIYGSF